MNYDIHRRVPRKKASKVTDLGKTITAVERRIRKNPNMSESDFGKIWFRSGSTKGKTKNTKWGDNNPKRAVEKFQGRGDRIFDHLESQMYRNK